MLERMLGAARLNVATFEDVESDKGATVQAMLVVIFVSIAGGIGGIIALGIWGLVFGLLGGLIQWALWALITFLISTTILKTPETHADWGQLARTTGFAQTPGLFKVLVFLPGIGSIMLPGTELPIILSIASIWQLAAMVIAVRQALDYQSTWRTIGVVVIGFVIVAVIQVIVVGLIPGGTEAAPGGQ